jgi:hypothetical protein
MCFPIESWREQARSLWGPAQIYEKEQEGNEIISRWLMRKGTAAGDTQVRPLQRH